MSKLNKLIVSKAVFGIAILLMLLFPFYRLGINFPTFLYRNILFDVRNIVSGIFFFVFCILSLVLYYDNKKYNKGNKKIDLFIKLFDSIFINAILIYFSSYGYISYIIPIGIVIYDVLISIISNMLLADGLDFEYKMVDKIKNFTLMVGILLILFYNLPFEFFNINVADAFLYFGLFMALFSLFETYLSYKKNIKVFLETDKESL